MMPNYDNYASGSIQNLPRTTFVAPYISGTSDPESTTPTNSGRIALDASLGVSTDVDVDTNPLLVRSRPTTQAHTSPLCTVSVLPGVNFPGVYDRSKPQAIQYAKAIADPVSTLKPNPSSLLPLRYHPLTHVPLSPAPPYRTGLGMAQEARQQHTSADQESSTPSASTSASSADAGAAASSGSIISASTATLENSDSGTNSINTSPVNLSSARGRPPRHLNPGTTYYSSSHAHYQSPGYPSSHQHRSPHPQELPSPQQQQSPQQTQHQYQQQQPQTQLQSQSPNAHGQSPGQAQAHQQDQSGHAAQQYLYYASPYPQPFGMPAHTSSAPSIPVASYTYAPHIYPHIPDAFTYGHGVGVGVGGPSGLTHPSYSEHDTNQQQQTQSPRHPQNQHQQHQHQHQHPQISIYGSMPVTTAGPYGYSLSAYAPTGTAVFTPQFSNGPAYAPYLPPHPPQYAQPTQQPPHAHGHAPTQGQPFSHSHSHSQLPQAQQQPPPQQQPQHSQYGQRPSLSLQSQQPPSSFTAPSSSHYQSPTQQRGYSPIVTSPSPGGPPSRSFSGHLSMGTMGSLGGPGGGPSALGLGPLPMHMVTSGVMGGQGSGSSGGFSSPQGSALSGPGAASGGNAGSGPSSGSHLNVSYGTTPGYGGMPDGYVSTRGLLSPASGSATGAANTTPGSGSGSSGQPNQRRGHNTGTGPSSGSGIGGQAYSSAPYGASSSGLPSGRSDLGNRSRTPGGHSFATAGSGADSGRDPGNGGGTSRSSGANRGGDKDSASGSSKNEKTDWVMWVGNVPSDATTDELYAFFGRAIGPGAGTGTGAGADGYGSGEHGEGERGGQAGATQDGEGASSGHGHRREGTSSAASTAATGATGGETSSKVDPASGVVSIFLISRSNCAFVNYTSEQALVAAVDYFNGLPLRSAEVDPRCPKLVCRVRKKGDDVKAGVGGQRGTGLHAKWVRQQAKTAAKDDKQQGPRRDAGQDAARHVDGEADDEGAPERPPLVRGGPAANNPKKSSSGSSVSYASTTSSLLTKNYPVRYFILKSLTKYDLDLSVQQGLWATQIHNEPILDQAYRTSQTVYLIFGVNKSGEFFGYAKMDGPIHEGAKNPHVEWASRDTPSGASGSARQSPVTRISPPTQPPIPEEKETEAKEENERESDTSESGARAGEAAGQVIHTRPVELPQIQHVSDDATTARPPTEIGHRDGHADTISTVDPAIAEPARHSVADEFPSRREEEKQPPIHQSSEPTRKQLHRQLAAHSAPPRGDNVGGSISNPNLAHLLPTGPLQDSPAPLTPGEDRALHSLDTTAPPAPQAEDFADDTGFRSAVEGSGRKAQRKDPISVASAPAALGRRPTALSAATGPTSAETWDGNLRARTLLSATSIEEMDEEVIAEYQDQNQDVVQLAQVSPGAPTTEGASHVDTFSVELPEAKAEADHRGEDAGFPSDRSTFDDTMSSLVYASTAPTSLPSNPSNPSNPSQPRQEVVQPTQEPQEPQEPQARTDGEDKASGKGGREEGWGSSFKVKWIRTDPLSFTRTRNLRNPWNHDREVKVSRDGTEVEPSIGQRLIEEWERPEPANTQETGGRSGQHPRTPRTPMSPVGPTSPTQTFAGKHRGHNKASGGWIQRESGQ